MSKFEILHKCVRHKTTDLKFCIRFVRGWSTKRRIFCAVFWICSIIDLKLSIFIKNVLTHIGKNSIIYLCMNQLIISYIYKFIPYTELNRFVGIVISLGILGVCCHVINKTFLRKIIGR